MLWFAMGVHIFVHNRHLYMSVVKSLLYVEAFKTQLVNVKLQTNQAGWLFIQKCFSARCLVTSVHEEISIHKMYQPFFLIVDKNMNVDSFRTKTSKQQYAKVPFKRVQFVSPAVQFTLFSLLLFCTICFSVTLPYITDFFVSPHHFSSGPSLIGFLHYRQPKFQLLDDHVA